MTAWKMEVEMNLLVNSIHSTKSVKDQIMLSSKQSPNHIWNSGSAQVLPSCLPQRRPSTWVVASRGKGRGGRLEVKFKRNHRCFTTSQ